jgi:carbonic anhydrase/acetyltransferase-like protein (isoleucine patch superfamily)
MKKIIITDKTLIPPFNEPARELRILNKPLWLLHRDVLSPYCLQEEEVDDFSGITDTDSELLVYRDNLYFDDQLLAAFLKGAKEKAKQGNIASRIAFDLDDDAIKTHAVHLQEGIRQEGDVYVADLWYFPEGITTRVEPVVVDTLAREIAYYHVPTYMADRSGDLGYQVPLLPFLSIENWVHLFIANVPFGVIAHGARVEASLEHLGPLLRILFQSLVERKQFLSSSAMVQMGRNVNIDPTAIIQGPAIIGDNVVIEAGAVVTNSIIGSNVTIGQGGQVMASVVSDGCYLPFRAAIFMTTLMDRAMVAQNTCLQMCVIGRNTFIGAGNTFTDFNLVGKTIRTMHKGELQDVGLPVLGGCVGHNCRIGSGLIVYPARMIESDVVIFARPERRVIAKNVSFEESDHHGWKGESHQPQYRPEQVLAILRPRPPQVRVQEQVEKRLSNERTMIERAIDRIKRL